ncbi:MAG: hypothetical protein HOY79_17495 [Streptomyces sp.]|nr:hypothetical protein [Streptomyces sp.]
MNSTTHAGIGRYRTRPVEVDAIRWLGEENCEETFAFLGLEHPATDEHHTFEAAGNA